MKPETKVFFFETPANPTMDVVDLAAVCGIARERGIVSVVDNAFATPALQRPMDFGADVTAYSATKMMDGQGRVLAGAVCGTEDFITNMLLPLLTTQRSLLGSYSTASMDVRVWPHTEVKHAAEQSRREDSRFMDRKVRPQSSDSCGVCRDHVRAARM